MIKIFLKDAHATQAAGAHLAAGLLPLVCPDSKSMVVFLHGTLGAGKSTWVRGFLSQAGVTGAMPSPTYSLVETYSSHGIALYHLDAYRLGDAAELEYLGVEEILNDGAVALVEWPDHIASELPAPVIEVTLDYPTIAAGINTTGAVIEGAAGGRLLSLRVHSQTDPRLASIAAESYWSDFDRM